MKKNITYSAFLKHLDSEGKPKVDDESLEADIKKLQLRLLRIQQGLFHSKDRAIIMLEGFDASGKGGAIRALTEKLDPRSVKVVPIGPPTDEEQGKHWLYRFWQSVPAPGTITVFDRSWYGRVLVEKVNKLTTPARLENAYDEINQFEAQLQNDGIKVIKFFLAITKAEQLKRFEDRLNDPYKQWKITMADLEARKNWDNYVDAVDLMLEKTDTKDCPWNVVPSVKKKLAHLSVLDTVVKDCKYWETWIEEAVVHYEKKELLKLLKKC